MRFPALILLAFSTSGFGAEWLRVRTPQLEILTDAGEKAARATLERLNLIRSVLATSPVSDPLPLRVFVFGSEAEFRKYSDGPVADGFYQPGVERDFIVLHAEAGLARAAIHEYVHLVLDRRTAPLPLWFEEGTAELYSNLDVRGHGMLVGEPIREKLATLTSEKWLSSRDLAAANRQSPFYNERALAGIFYAESWALVHMLNFAPGWRERMPQFAEQLAAGNADAFHAAFGKTMDQALSDLPGYASRMRGVSVDAPPRANEPPPTVERLPSLAASLACADLALHLQHVDLSRSLMEGAFKAQPESAQLEAGFGSIALAEGDSADARSRFERAIVLGSRDAEVYFQLAMLERDAGAPGSRVDALLEKTIELDPAFGEAHFLLGLHMTDSDPENAVQHLTAAARASPGKSYVWHALGYAQMRLGDTGSARLSASRALQTSATEQEERMAKALLDSLK
ncbi:MAG TPA: hypothetical protein VH639_08555 [Bryobacteraceae bacterium]|jgi:tetratricopeptide (TPR) repeat protein